MTDAATTDAGADKTQTEVRSTQAEKSVADLLAEFSTEKPKQETAKAEARTSPKDMDEFVGNVTARVEASQVAKEEFNTWAKEIADAADLPLQRAKALLTGELTSRADLAQAWFARGGKPGLFKELRAALVKEVADEVNGVVTKRTEKTSDKAAFRAAARVSTATKDEPERKYSIKELSENHAVRQSMLRGVSR